MKDNFRCKALEGGYCDRCREAPVPWKECRDLKNLEAPCASCTASSPRNHKQCNGCNYREWKMIHYQEGEADKIRARWLQELMEKEKEAEQQKRKLEAWKRGGENQDWTDRY